MRRSVLLCVIVSLASFLGGCRGERPGAADPALDSIPLLHILAPEEAARLAAEANSSATGIPAPGFALSLWASEPLVANPAGLAIDNLGRIYFTNTTRTGTAEFDIRNHPDWMIASINFRTVEDRRSFLRRELDPSRSEINTFLQDFNQDGVRDWRDLTVHRERIYRIEDTDGDGLADLSSLLIADFHDEHTDTGLSVLPLGDDVYFAAAPDLWRLRDTNGDGRLDSKESLSHGYGVHIGFGAHGMSGVTMGPDGRIYWGIGDIGLNVVDQDGRRWSYPNQGAILRSEPDGSGFEVFAAGLRNTHEFVFDELGNLISVDNDGDHPGEMERLVYLVNGSDSGWRINWQFGKYTDPTNNSYKVWMDEGYWRPRFPEQAAHLLPPIASYHSGPAGMVYNPGTALSPEWKNHFFISAFTGSTTSTRIHAFTLEEEGAGFRLASDTIVLRGVLTTGMDIGPDGALYLADWITGWSPTSRGRIWKFDTPEEAGSPLRSEVQRLLAEDFEDLSSAELLALLGNEDMRVRSKAQFELVERDDRTTLETAALQGDPLLARVHGLWGIGQLARANPTRATLLVPFLTDTAPEVRAQAAKLLGDVRHTPAAPLLLPLLADESARVRFFATEALGRTEYALAVEPILRMLEENDDQDVYLRHGGAIALARIGESAPLAGLAVHPSRALRIAAVVALRRMQDPAVALFLNDYDEYVVAEAARAINDDESIEDALPALARLLDARPEITSEPILRRAIAANLRMGDAESARRLASYAARASAPEALRVDALYALSVLPEPSVLDRVDGSPRGEVRRDSEVAVRAVDPLFSELLMDPSASLRVAATDAALRLELNGVSPLLLARLQGDPSINVRRGALRALSGLRQGPLEPALRTALADLAPEVRMDALLLLPGSGLSEGVISDLLLSVVADGTVQEKQAAVTALGELGNAASIAALGDLLSQLDEGTLPPEIQLELREAIEGSASTELTSRGDAILTRRGSVSITASFEDILLGGNRNRGQQIAMRNESAGCTRCHTFGGQPSDVGPSLQGVGTRLTRSQIVEALVDPSSGLEAPSPMPAIQGLLTRGQLRDLVEYLSSLR